MAFESQKRAPRRPSPGFLHRLRGNFLTGIVVVAPVILTFYIIWTVVTFIDAQVVPWVPAVYNPSTWLGTYVPGFGVVIFIVFTAVIGTLTKNLFGRQLVRYGESLVERMPVVRSVYNALKQIVETVLSQSKSSFKHACLIQYPSAGIWSIGFVATETTGEILDKVGERDMLSVFVPTTPNPTSGFLLFLPRRDVVILDMTIEQAAKLIISGGLVGPPAQAVAAAKPKPATARAPATVGR